jgi:hypothetical protein
MLTRRQLLAAVSSAALLSKPAAFGVQLIEEPHALAAESARGYRRLAIRSGWIIAPGVRELTQQTCASLLRRVRAGAWLLLESGLCYAPREQAVGQAEILRHGLGLQIQPPIDAHSYVRYSWPIQRMIRPFQALTPVLCGSHEVIATCRGLPVCLRREIGAGGIIYLGSMLGPGLMAEEREAHQVGSVLLHT